MTPKFFDVHTHLNMLDLALPQFKELAPDWRLVGKGTLEQGVWFVNIGADAESSRLALEQAREFSLVGAFAGVGATVGIHPTEAWSEADFALIGQLAEDKLVLAIGECGLEYFRITDEVIRQKQCELFNKHIQLAIKLGKPLMIHCRPSEGGGVDAYEDLYEILSSYPEVVSGQIAFNLHFFAGDWPIAQRFLKLGAYLSFPGVITFSHQFDDIIKKMPLDRLMSETDAPFVAPVPHRGKRNEPAFVSYVAYHLASLRGEEEGVVLASLVSNAKRFFNL